MKKLVYCLVFTSAIVISLPSNAQQDSTESKPVFKIGMFYSSRLHYFGRTDSLRSSAILPVPELWITPKLYVNAAPVFVSNKMQQMAYAGTVATVGVQLNKPKSFTHIYLVKPFYRNSSQLPQSVLNAQAAASFTWRNPVLNITTGADLKFSNQTDIGITGGLDHPFTFQLDKKAILVIDPSAYVYAGTQRFTQTYYEKKKFLFFEGPEQEVTRAVSKINVLSYEFSVPVVYRRDKLILIATPALVVPQNFVSNEYGTNMFYVTTGIKLTI